MTAWQASVGELLDYSADALICSANPQLNLSGGVGGEILRRYGAEVQRFLHDRLRQSGHRFLPPGRAIAAPSCGSPFRAVIHAVAIDPFYETSSILIRQAYGAAFSEAVKLNCSTVVAACLACGYGRASPNTFVEAIMDFVARPFAGLDNVHFVSTNTEIIEAVKVALAVFTD